MADHAETERVRESRRDADVLPFPSLGRRDRSATAPGTGSEPRLRTVIGEVLRDERHEQERTLADVADVAAVSLPYLSEVERGTKEVSSDLLAAICDALHLELVDVLERSAHRLRPQAGSGSGVLALAA
jgi:DNA-binding Xre family transcriptional regulator